MSNKLSYLETEWREVFKFATKKAKTMCSKNSNLTYAKAMKKAWRDPKVLAKKEAYVRKKKAFLAKKRKTVRRTTRKKASK